jgi:RNA polymerase sigma-70 factor (ECF subfamily)
MLRSSKVRRWEETDDLLQNVLIRLTKALTEKIEVPRASDHWWRLAAKHIRWELKDVARRCSRLYPEMGAPMDQTPDPYGEPSTLDDWTLFHESVESLPGNEREAFSLTWYAGLTQEEAAKELNVALRTIKRRLLRARILLACAVRGAAPPWKMPLASPQPIPRS